MTWLRNHWGLVLINILALVPLLSLVAILGGDLPADGRGGPNGPDGPSGAVCGKQHMKGDHDGGPLTVCKAVIHVSGEWAVRWLVVSLTFTPLYILFGWRRQLRYRKLFGLYAFGYTAIHATAFIVDRGVLHIFAEWNFIIGLAAALLMLALAATSSRWAICKLRKRWKPLHRMAYVAGALAVLHVVVLGKGSWQLYAWLLGIGFVLRLSMVRTAVVGFRCRLFGRVTEAEVVS